MKEQIETMLAELQADLNKEISKNNITNMAYQLGVEKGITKMHLLLLHLEIERSLSFQKEVVSC